MRMVGFLIAILAVSFSSSLKAGTCRVTPIVAKDTGNIVGYLVTGDAGSVVIQNLGSASSACNLVTKKPITQT